MTDQSEEAHALARFIKDRRTELGINHRELADEIRRQGGVATLQAVQQWEYVRDGLRTTRPAQSNIEPLAKALKVDPNKVGSLWDAAKRAGRGGHWSELRDKRTSVRIALSPMRLLFRRYPGWRGFHGRGHTLFGIRKDFDYLTEKLALEVLTCPSNEHPATPASFESAFWRLTWMLSVDREMATHQRIYAIALYAPGDEPADYWERRINKELVVIDAKLVVEVVRSVDELHQMLKDYDPENVE